MKLTNLLSTQKSLILDRWLNQILANYPPQTAQFFKREKDRFDNPVGYRIIQGITELYQGLVSGADRDQLLDSLDEVVRIWAVQDFTPSQALAFVFLLKKIIREELAQELQDLELAEECLELESRIDGLALLGFDVYMKRREKLYEIRVDEVKKRIGGLLRSKGIDLANL
ncbi:MAG: hypothetical protein FJ126_03850 [Deltaproteobacteria bacterium]|nr:hypothetical protein [Deltaproteobacteria bacterium]